MKKKIKGVLFDFNGTMVFDSEEHKQAWDVFSRQYRNRPITDEELDHMHGKTNKAIIEFLLEGSVSAKNSVQLSKDKEALYREICRKEKEEYHLVDGLPELLDELKRKQIPMTICSASIQENIAFFIERFQLEHWFSLDTIVFDDGSHANKISMFQEGANHLHVALEDCLIIEDSLSGLFYANEVKAASIIAITTPDKVEEYKKLPGIDHIIFNYEDLEIENWYDLLSS